MQTIREKVDAYIDAHAGEIEAYTARLVRIPSVKGPAEPGMPYGRAVADVLREGDAMCREIGLTTSPFEGRCVTADLNDRETVLAILCHLDVVPVEGEPQRPPFTVVRDGDFLWGRGTCDNKGPTAAVLMAAQAVAACGVPLKYNARIFLGGDEECGGSDVVAYARTVGLPRYVFVPDASFPVGISERGMIRFSVKVPVTDTAVRELRAGVKVNVIPGEAEALLAGVPADAVCRAASVSPLETEVTEEPDGVRLAVHGTSGHSSAPSAFKNALTALIGILAALEPDCALWKNINAAFPYGVTDGSALLGFGDACTLSLTVARLENGLATFEGDSRVFVGASAQALAQKMQENFPYGIDFARVTDPHSVPADDPLVGLLQEVYKDHTGRDDPPYHMPAMTYAHKSPNAVIFGSGMPGDRHGGAHGSNECVNVNTLVTAAKIFADSIVRICGADSGFVDLNR